MKIAVCELNGRSGHDAGRALLSELYLAETGDTLPEICVTPKGKPYFPDGKLHFSISHTEHFAFCALSHHPVGIDAEELGRRVSPAMRRRALSPAEQDRINNSGDPGMAFLSLWVLKEASVKLSGEGLRGFPNKTDFSPDDPRVFCWHRCLVAVMSHNPSERIEKYAV